MIDVNNEHACSQNHSCRAVSSCPEGAISQHDIFSAPRVDHKLCTECGACAQVCRVFSQVPDDVGVR